MEQNFIMSRCQKKQEKKKVYFGDVSFEKSSQKLFGFLGI